MTLFYLAGSILLAGALFLNRNALINKTLVIIFLLLQVCYTAFLVIYQNCSDAIYFKSDALAILMTGTLTIIAIPALLHRYDYVYKEQDSPANRGMYYGAMVIFIMALTAGYTASHIAVTWIFVEITTLSTSVLTFHRRNAGSIEATWKYIFVCSISLVFVFIGILLLSLAMNNEYQAGMQYSTLVQLAPSLDPFWLKLAFIFIFTGYTAKLGLVPMYTAGIDAKDKAPAPASALFSSVLMNLGFVGILRMYIITEHASIHAWVNAIILITALLSIFVATVYLLKVRNIKRMLAYSSIEHMGIVMVGIGTGGIGYYAAILQLILHSFVKSSLFLQVGHLYKTFKSKEIFSIGNYFKYNTPGAVFLLLAFIGIAAIPPSGLFISEFYLVLALIQAHQWFVLILILILLTIILWTLGKNVFKILFVPPLGFNPKNIEKGNGYETLSHYLLLGLTVYLGFCPPQGFVNLIQSVVHSITF
ncbi:proton-conducting transporter membrane subunit [Microbacter margulisiae]|uniref:Hydrogenase-4 component F n=1 Tax=Microbacter margulisiae TaxID=1350067 RepID=A0A7W5H1M9_9PORP|nr:proton-conducting transporter membrane subunit [Microbacter margulisiae]MBB3186860.1 hydrogenase-4 component F [Microbacter margulisiae]